MVAGIVAALSFLGCDPLTDSEYRGEAQLIINGQIRSLGEVPAGRGLSVRLVWSTFFGEDAHSVDAEELTDSGFPLQFSLPLYEDPSEVSLNDATLIEGGEGAIGFAFIVVVSDDEGDTGELREDQLAGLAYEHVVVFVRELNAAALDVVDEIIINGVDLRPGFNLARTRCGDEVFDRLEIVQDIDVVIDSVEPDRESCLNFY